MNDSDLKKVAQGWILHANEIAVNQHSEKYSWAWDEVFDLKYENPSLLWKLILEIHASDPEPSVVEVLSAGPLEDLLSMHGSDFIELVENKARKDPSFAFLLGGVWKGSMQDDVWERVQEVWDRSGWDGIPRPGSHNSHGQS